MKLAYSRCPSFDEVIPALLAHGPEGLNQHVGFKPGVPVKPMLAKPASGVSEVLDRFSAAPFTCEYKYDGERAQIHLLEGGGVKIYSRNSEDNTGKFPDVAAALPALLQPGIKSAVLDAETVAYDREQGRILPFQARDTREGVIWGIVFWSRRLGVRGHCPAAVAPASFTGPLGGPGPVSPQRTTSPPPNATPPILLGACRCCRRGRART